MTLDFDRAKKVDLDDRFPLLDLKDHRYPYYRGLEYLDKLPTDTPRMIKSHLHYFLLPDDITQRKKGKVHMNREIKYLRLNYRFEKIKLFHCMNFR